MTITAHSVAPEEIMAFLDGELSIAEAETVAAHIEQCLECAGLARELRNTSQSMSAWEVPNSPSSLDESVKALAAQTAFNAKPARPGAYIRFRRLNWKVRAVIVGGAVAAAIIFAVIVGPVMSDSSYRQSRRSKTVVREQGAEIGDFASSGSRSIDGQPITDQQSKTSESINGPLNGRSRSFSSLVQLAAPGAAADSNGLFHGLGDHVENSFPAGANGASVPAPMIARVASLTILVKDVAASRSSVDALLARHHGYSANLNISTPENAPRSFEASLRIPAPELILAIGDLKTLGRVENESQSGEEVTQQHTDLVARLKTARDTEERFETILTQRTGNVSEVLQVEEGIARVRGEIESMEAEQKALEHRVDFATVDLQLTEEYKAQLNPSAPSASTRLHNAFIAGIRHASGALFGIVLFFVAYGPVLLIWLLIVGFPVYLVWRRYRKLHAGI
jgi:F0F1-type ATP synthase assembly protein I